MDGPPGALSIGEVSSRTGLSVHALRFYERSGVFRDAVPRVGGRRVFTEDHVEWLALCVVLRASGMPLAAIRAYAELVRRGDGTEAQRLEVLREHEASVTSRRRSTRLNAAWISSVTRSASTGT